MRGPRGEGFFEVKARVESPCAKRAPAALARAGAYRAGGIALWTSAIVGVAAARGASREGGGPKGAHVVDDMVSVAGGAFEMGSDDSWANEDELPVHGVVVPGFLLDRTEVTVAAYAQCVRSGACTEPDRYQSLRADRRAFCNWRHPEERADHPVNCVDFAQATSFCQWAGKRLPSEAEWEYAARGGGEARRFPWGNGKIDETRLNACGTECPAHARAKGLPGWPPMYPASDGWPETAAVGSFPAGVSKWGALDLAGNVWEWTASSYETYDGRYAEPARVLRGGSWGGSDPRTERTTNRFRLPPSSRAQFLGFRCAK